MASPIAEYKGSYVILGNGTLSWRNYTVETPRKTYYWLDYQEDENEHSSVWVQVYRKNDHPLLPSCGRYDRTGPLPRASLPTS
ncbi:hypothetical protein [Thermococcus peptonophilus]|uniref:hypothetical protein n=1 Tax=Thermococcus peptonophilus TaxID=53952 RepID=UPI0006D26014